jgi:TonB family protein
MWITADDYPAQALRNREHGVVALEVQVDPAGKPSGCRTAKSSGSVVLDTKTCEIVMLRSSFRPATDASGKATVGLWPMKVTWYPPVRTWTQARSSGLPRVPPASFAQVERLTFDAEGRIVGCSNQKAGDLGNELEGCARDGDGYLLTRVFGTRYRSGVLTHFATQRVEGDPLPPDAPTTDVPPSWTVERAFTVRSDGSVADCTQRESGKGVVPCDAPKLYEPRSDGQARHVAYETRWAFQPSR